MQKDRRNTKLQFQMTFSLASTSYLLKLPTNTINGQNRSNSYTMTSFEEATIPFEWHSQIVSSRSWISFMFTSFSEICYDGDVLIVFYYNFGCLKVNLGMLIVSTTKCSNTIGCWQLLFMAYLAFSGPSCLICDLACPITNVSDNWAANKILALHTTSK